MSHHVIVLGAGATGLGAALGVSLSDADVNVTILEKNDRPGGLAGSFSWKGHIVDKGPHRLSPNLHTVRVIAEDLLGPDCLVNKSQHGVQMGGRLYQFPPRLSDWMAPKAIFEAVAYFSSFLWHKLRWIFRRFDKDDFESLMISRFGRRFYLKILSPMTEKVWTAPSEIDAGFATQRFSLITPREILKKMLVPRQELNPSSFYYPRKGFQQLWDNMAAHLERSGKHIAYEGVPLEIHVDGNHISHLIYEQNGKRSTINAEKLNVVSTIPLIHLLSILKWPEAKGLIEKANRIRFRSMLLVALEFNQRQTLPFRTLIYPETDFCFNRLFEQNLYSTESVEEGKSVIVADITLFRGDATFQLPDAEIISRVTSDLAKLSYIDLEKLSDARVERVEFAYGVPDVASRRAFYEIQHELKRIHNLFLLGRFSAGEYDNSDYAIENGVSLGKMLAGATTPLEYLLGLQSLRGRTIVG